jgi:hypothetical protein
MSDPASLNVLLARVQELSRQSLRPLGGRLVGDAQETMLDNYRSIARLAALALQALRGPDGEVSDAAVQAAQYLLQITRLCVEEHTRICREEDARRARAALGGSARRIRGGAARRPPDALQLVLGAAGV